MKSHRQQLWFHASRRRELFRITEKVQDAVAKSGVAEGLVLVNAMHITGCASPSHQFLHGDE